MLRMFSVTAAARIAIAALFATATIATSNPASAAPFGFGVDADSNLYTIDLGAGSATLIGGTGVFLEAIAVSGSGDLYGTDTSGNLYLINTTTGVATLIGGTNRGNIEALDFNGTTLVGVSFSNIPTVFSIDTTTAATTNIVTATSATGLVRAGAFLDADTLLVRGDSGCPADCLYSLDLGTGVPTLIGEINAPGLVTGLDFASDGLFYGLDGQGNLFRVNPATGATSNVFDLGAQFWLGFAAPAQAVPEPVALTLFGVAAAAGYLRKRKGGRR